MITIWRSFTEGVYWVLIRIWYIINGFIRWFLPSYFPMCPWSLNSKFGTPSSKMEIKNTFSTNVKFKSVMSSKMTSSISTISATSLHASLKMKIQEPKRKTLNC